MGGTHRIPLLLILQRLRVIMILGEGAARGRVMKRPGGPLILVILQQPALL